MAIDKIGGINASNFPLSDITKKTETDFSNVFGEALNTIAQTDQADKVGNVNMLAGDGETMHGVLINAEKADLALRMTLQVRNKVIDAYNEVMRMQI